MECGVYPCNTCTLEIEDQELKVILAYTKNSKLARPSDTV